MTEEEEEQTPDNSLISTERLVLASPFIDGNWLMNKVIRPRHIFMATHTDDDGPSNSIFFSSDQDKLVYKDDDDGIHNLY